VLIYGYLCSKWHPDAVLTSKKQNQHKEATSANITSPVNTTFGSVFRRRLNFLVPTSSLLYHSVIAQVSTPSPIVSLWRSICQYEYSDLADPAAFR